MATIRLLRLSSISDVLEELAKVEPDLAAVVDLKFFCGFSFAFHISGFWADYGQSEPYTPFADPHRPEGAEVRSLQLTSSRPLGVFRRHTGQAHFIGSNYEDK